MKTLHRLPQVRYVEFTKKQDAWGRWIPPIKHNRPGIVEVDSRLEPSAELDTLLHELLHEYFRDTTEEKVDETATLMAAVLWREGYRKVKQ
jgi:hypothetical protein